jgi:heptosyltransferase-2/heptosyltransferase-3
MPKRRRWSPVRGTANRIHYPLDRFAISAVDLPGRLAFGLAGLLRLRRQPSLDTTAIRDVLVLRLDRIGDVLMSLPALADLRAALPGARIRLAVGNWSLEVARSAPVDEVLVWSAPWVGRPSEGSESVLALCRKARALRAARLDLALDLQGDPRSAALLWLTGARIRAGYGNGGGGYLLTHVLPLDETVSWVEECRRAVAALVGPAAPPRPFDPLGDDDRAFARRLFETLKLESRRPLVGVHPSGGRTIKQWDVGRFAEVAARLQREFGATILITGAEADRALSARIAAELPGRPFDLAGRLSVRETMAVISALDLFLSPDTGPMHMACAVGTPSVSVFGPSDPVRYFSGGEGGAGSRHLVVRADLWCSPCNLIRKPPAECAVPAGPECLRLVAPDAVYQATARLLRTAGYSPA